ncbi:hypothetical protein L3X38_038667 [Prunus dulcis]|uniref:Uncharacterized protein n=1 Tax=Prunus dulcis TaxID=3755 RepID=A0AAD4V5N6_PRUDU|nr:hypothetical protein L3X38_038667 [Prunus dulcis]
MSHALFQQMLFINKHSHDISYFSEMEPPFSLNSQPNLASKAPEAKLNHRRDLQEVQLARTSSSRRAQESTTRPSTSSHATYKM